VRAVAVVVAAAAAAAALAAADIDANHSVLFFTVGKNNAALYVISMPGASRYALS